MDGHRARPLTGEMVDAADVIFVMEHAQRDYVRALDSAANVHLLAADGSEVADPYGEDLASYEVVYATIGAALKVRLAELDNL